MEESVKMICPNHGKCNFSLKFNLKSAHCKGEHVKQDNCDKPCEGGEVGPCKPVKGGR